MRGTEEVKWRRMENGRKNSVQTFSFRKLWPVRDLKRIAQIRLKH